MEAHEHSAVEKATTLMKDFFSSFRRITYTLHPYALPDEARGKSSNISWATRSASRYYRTHSQTNVIFTTMDADTHLLSSYFEFISYDCSRNSENSNTFTMYVPPIVFDRNAHSISPIVRCADMLWCAAGISALYDSSRVRTPTSVYSITMMLARYVGFWDTGPDAIGEDLHMYLKCYFKTRGLIRSVSVFSPASHCNVVHENWTPHMSVLERWRLSSAARFMQACRHMWGMVDSGYAIRETWRMILTRDRQAQSSSLEEVDDEEMYDCDAELGRLENTRNSIKAQKATPAAMSPAPVLRTVVLLHRLYEAHFLPVHYFLDVLACSLMPVLISVPQNSLLGQVLRYTNHLRTAAFFGVVVQLLLYESFHSTALRLRAEQITSALSSQTTPEVIKQALGRVGFSARKKFVNILDYILFPVAGTVFGAVPSIKAQIMQLWTTNFVYRVSPKPRAELQKGN